MTKGPKEIIPQPRIFALKLQEIPFLFWKPHFVLIASNDKYLHPTLLLLCLCHRRSCKQKLRHCWWYSWLWNCATFCWFELSTFHNTCLAGDLKSQIVWVESLIRINQDVDSRYDKSKDIRRKLGDLRQFICEVKVRL